MRKRLFLYTVLLLFTGLLCFFCVSIYITHANNLELAKDMVIDTAQSYARLYHADIDLGHFVRTDTDTRITVVAPDGSVLADSRPLDAALRENRLDRPEIQAAVQGAPKAFVRYSDSLGVDFIYYALKAPDRDSFVYIRAAVPVARIDRYLYQSLPLLIIVLLIIIFLCYIFTRGMISRITKPFESVEHKLRRLSEGEYIKAPAGGSYEEIDVITKGIDEVAQVLQKSITGLRDEKNKLSYILDNIGDGLIVLDEDKNIALINAAALSIFNAKPDIVGKGLNYLTFNEVFMEAADGCIEHEKGALFELTLNGRIYLIAIKRLPGAALTMAALSDVTESRENAKRREEFFANASHELKTPLTAIKGFNELAAINNKDRNIKKYINGIVRETERMITLIGDMLKLSELESAKTVNPVTVSLAKIAGEVYEALLPVIDEKSIAFTVAGDAEVQAEQGHMYELVKNLAENAVLYNNRGGNVSVTIDSTERGAWLHVLDDGVGISPEEQTRIFERFYRVEKSRSQRYNGGAGVGYGGNAGNGGKGQTGGSQQKSDGDGKGGEYQNGAPQHGGGTGLGLSIVKHVCALYDWKLSLKSKPGIGTEVMVVFYGSV